MVNYSVSTRLFRRKPGERAEKEDGEKHSDRSNSFEKTSVTTQDLPLNKGLAPVSRRQGFYNDGLLMVQSARTKLLTCREDEDAERPAWPSLSTLRVGWVYSGPSPEVHPSSHHVSVEHLGPVGPRAGTTGAELTQVFANPSSGILHTSEGASNKQKVSFLWRKWEHRGQRAMGQGGRDARSCRKERR